MRDALFGASISEIFIQTSYCTCKFLGTYKIRVLRLEEDTFFFRRIMLQQKAIRITPNYQFTF